ncbi:MAG TPA: O-antigen ligase family protein [Chitinophagaceae bacterium]|nr:O-antigen ligase family protein [Chitinophagaceae bacterium]
MENLQIPISPLPQSKWQRIISACRRIVLIEKLNNVAGIIFLILSATVLAAGVSIFGIIFAILFSIALIALPVIYALVVYPKFGILVYLTMAYSIAFLGRAGVNFPLGTLMDAMLVLLILGVFIQQKKKNDWGIFNNPISWFIIIWIGYNFVEVINPSAESKLAWVYTVRTVAMLALSFFIFLYNIRSKSFIKLILKWWIVLCLIAASYAFKQEYFGFTSFEEAYLYHDPNVKLLLFIAGHWRKFSIFSDPVTFAYNMVTVSLLCIALLTGPVNKIKKVLLVFAVGFYLLNMLYSGTRGAYPLVPAALILYAILNFSKKILIFSIIAAVFIVGLILMPTSNQTIVRFQSAFKPNNDPSYLVRKINQARIKPFVWTHPMGGGLGATGEWGQKFAPYSYLSNFPPDSGYVRVTVELGWIGLAVFCLMMFTILRTGINNFYKIRDAELKSYCLAAVLIVFALNIGNFPQEALVQFPSNVNFYLAAALIIATLRIDKEQNELLINLKKVE